MMISRHWWRTQLSCGRIARDKLVAPPRSPTISWAEGPTTMHCPAENLGLPPQADMVRTFGAEVIFDGCP